MSREDARIKLDQYSNRVLGKSHRVMVSRAHRIFRARTHTGVRALPPVAKQHPNSPDGLCPALRIFLLSRSFFSHALTSACCIIFRHTALEHHRTRIYQSDSISTPEEKPLRLGVTPELVEMSSSPGFSSVPPGAQKVSNGTSDET